MTKKEMKELFAQAWKEVFQVEDVKDDDDFFELGGDSIKGVQIITWLLQKGIKLEAMKVFTEPTFGELCEYLEETKPMYVPESIVTKEKAGKASPSPATAQQGQLCTPEQMMAAQQGQLCTPQQMMAAQQGQLCTPEQMMAAQQGQLCTPEQMMAAQQGQLCTPEQMMAAQQGQLCTPQQMMAAQQSQLCTPQQMMAAQQGQLCTPQQMMAAQQGQLCTPEQMMAAQQGQLCTPQQMMAAQQGQLCTPQQMMAAQQGQLCTPEQMMAAQQNQLCTPQQGQLCTPQEIRAEQNQLCTIASQLSMLLSSIVPPMVAPMGMPAQQKPDVYEVDKPIENPNVIAIEEPHVGVPTKSPEEALAIVFSLIFPQGYGKDENLFEKGLDSFKIMQIVTRAAENGYRIKMQDIFKNPTFNGIVGVMEAGK